MWRIGAYTLTVVMVGSVLWPLTWEPKRDSYPLSTYPMFTSKRSKPWINYLRALASDGEAQALKPKHLGNDEVMQAAVTVNRAVGVGAVAMKSLCHDVAHRVASEPAYATADTIQIVGEQYDPIAYFAQSPSKAVVSRVIRFQCKVGSR